MNFSPYFLDFIGSETLPTHVEESAGYEEPTTAEKDLKTSVKFLSDTVKGDIVNTRISKEGYSDVSIEKGIVVPQDSFAAEGFAQDFDDDGQDDDAKAMPVMSTTNSKGYRVFGVLGLSDDQRSSCDGSESKF